MLKSIPIKSVQHKMYGKCQIHLNENNYYQYYWNIFGIEINHIDIKITLERNLSISLNGQDSFFRIY
jgi:hypothetical protein